VTIVTVVQTLLRLMSGIVLAALSIHSAGAQPNCPLATLPAYAHNDYLNDRPLLDALSLGFRGVEVDVFLIDDTLRMGHDRRQASRAPAFEHTYLAPLRARLADCARLTNLNDPFVLAVEIKESSPHTYHALRALLAQYAELFAIPEGATPNNAAPVDVILVGWHPPLDAHFDSMSPPVVLGVQHRLSSDKARVESLDPRVRLLSLDYGKTMGRWWRTRPARQRWLGMLRDARVAAPGRLMRVYNVPVDARVYDELRDAGVDLLGTKQLEQTQQLLRPGVTP